MSESISGISDLDFDQIHVPRIGRESGQSPSLKGGMKLQRREFRKEHELIEINYGIEFSQLKDSEEQKKRLREFLKRNQQELNWFVEEGSAPVFGYPPMCYSPPETQNQTPVAKTVKKISDSHKNYLSILMKHVFNQNKCLASVEDIIDAKEAEDDLQN